MIFGSVVATIATFLPSSPQSGCAKEEVMNKSTNDENISFHAVPLVCDAAPEIGCGSRSKPLLLDQDGARIRFDGRGYGLRGAEIYQTNLTLVFSTEDARYTWLTKLLGVMEGEFDEKAGRASWNVYVPAGSH